MPYKQEDIEQDLGIDFAVRVTGVIIAIFLVTFLPTWAGNSKINFKLPFYGKIEVPLNPFTNIPDGKPLNNYLVDVGSNSSTGSCKLSTDFDINNGIMDDEITAIFHTAICLGVKDPWQISYMLATAQHETGNFSTTSERGSFNYFAYQAGGNGYAHRLGNKGPEDAVNFRGRGLIQATGRANVQRLSELYKVDFVANPELLEKPEYATVVLVEGMLTGFFTDKSLGQYVDKSRGKKDFRGARRVVNDMDQADKIARIAEAYKGKVEIWMADYDLK